MKKLFAFTLLTTILVILASCNEHKKASHPFDGTFITAHGIRFNLRPDSTSTITFNDSITYNGKWTIRHTDSLEYANIEFDSYINYYYLKDGKIYRSEENMKGDTRGVAVEYQE